MCDSDNSLQSQDKLKLELWGLPKPVCEKYKSLGINRMFPWQLECLSCKDVLTGGNVIYSAPTSAGKTMVAEILVLQTVLERKKKAIIILPFISVVREKMLYFQDLFSSTGIRTEGFMGSYAPPGGLKAVHIAVCTIEKANNIINRLLEDQRLEEIGCVVVDELHLLGDQYRGYLLELLLTKVKYMNLKNPLVEIQIVGMSATLPNLPDLARWLDASLYTTDFRPVPLTEYLIVGNDVLSAANLSLCYTIQPTIPVTASQNMGILFLCIDTLLSGHSALVFCHTRNSCETLSEEIAKEIYRLGCNQSDLSLALQRQLDSSNIRDLLEQLKRCPAGLDQSLKRSVSFGVAFHHAGLTMDERDIIESAYRTGVIRVIVATTTLSSGVNLPSRRVIIKCPLETREIDILSYKQMVGRAGRMGKDTSGESFLICNAKERNMGERIVTAKLPSVSSCLAIGSQTSLKRAVLEVIASGTVNSCSELEKYLKCTFLFNNNNFEVTDPVWSCVEYLQNNEFININENVIEATPLAEACLSASISPDQGLKLLKELHKARQCFVLETELHIIYQVKHWSEGHRHEVRIMNHLRLPGVKKIFQILLQHVENSTFIDYTFGTCIGIDLVI